MEEKLNLTRGKEMISFKGNRRQAEYKIILKEDYVDGKDKGSMNKILNSTLNLEKDDGIFKTFSINTNSNIEVQDIDLDSKLKLEFAHKLSLPFQNAEFTVRNTGELLSINSFNYIKSKSHKIKVDLLMNYEPVDYIKYILIQTDLKLEDPDFIKHMLFSNDIYSVLFLPIYEKEVDNIENFNMCFCNLIDEDSVMYKTRVRKYQKNLVNNEIYVEIFGEIDSVYTNDYNIRRIAKERFPDISDFELSGRVIGEFIFELDTGWLKRAVFIKRAQIGDVYLNRVTYEVVMK